MTARVMSKAEYLATVKKSRRKPAARHDGRHDGAHRGGPRRSSPGFSAREACTKGSRTASVGASSVLGYSRTGSGFALRLKQRWYSPENWRSCSIANLVKATPIRY